MALVEQYWSSNVKRTMFLDPDVSVNDQRVDWLLARSYLSKIVCSAVDQLNQSVECHGAFQMKQGVLYYDQWCCIMINDHLLC